MRAAAAAAVSLLLAGCGQPGDRPPVPSQSAAARHVDPGNIRRVRRDLPPGYEVAPVNATAPSSIWGLGGVGIATPPRCAPLAEPGGSDQRAQGISGSGAGGTVYAVVVAGPFVLDRGLLGQCRQWAMTGKRASAHVHLVDAPRIDGADT